MKKVRKIALYTYRVLLFLVLFLSAFLVVFLPPFLLLCHVILFLMEKLALLCPPYSVWGVFVLMFVGGIWAIVSESRLQREAKRAQAERKEMERLDFTAELTKIVEDCLIKYPYEVQKGENEFTLFMPNHSRTIHFDIGLSGIDMQIFVGGWDEEGYYVAFSENLNKLAEKLSSDLDDWLNDRIAQVCFITDEDRFPYSFACSADDIDEVVSEKFSGYSSDPWWWRLLRFVFLFPPPKPVLEIQITSANGVHDRIISCDEIRSRVI